jgi:hypothetical protein
MVMILMLLLSNCEHRCLENGKLLVLNEENYDFGEVEEGTAISHVFEFNNCADDTLRISRVRGTWGCTASLLSSEVIAPGQSGEIKITFNTKGKKGQNTKTVYIYSNDPDSPIRKITITATVVPKTAAEKE